MRHTRNSGKPGRPEPDRRLETPTFGTLLERRFSRRSLIGAAGALACASALPAWPSRRARSAAFEPVAAQRTDAVVLPKGYRYDLIAGWGDSLFPGVPDFTARDLKRNAHLADGAAERQMRQFGTNCDAIVYFPISGKRSDRGILCVNHEYVQAELSFAGRKSILEDTPEERKRWVEAHPQAVDVMKAAHGVSVLEVSLQRGRWTFTPGAPLTRRITAETICEICGPARGAPQLRTREDPTGTKVRGTFANCAGGRTPWGTYLTSEENIDDYFALGSLAREPKDEAIVEAHRRFPLLEHSYYGWEHVDRRFDLQYEPNEPLRFGWIVEIDPRDPTSVPRKRTALGRFSHEGAETVVARDGRVAVYMGDDDKFEYVYKFVTRRPFDPHNPAANRDLLDDGTLYVARFDADGTGEWLPLVYDERGPLNRRSGFTSQADVVIRARAAADLLGATPMDRPEDIHPSPVDGRVYIACTNNTSREPGSRLGEWAGRTIDLGPNAANPRPRNATGHIIELTEDDGDAAATRFRWNVFLLAGNPGASEARFLVEYEQVMRAQLAATATYYAGFRDSGAVSPIACPDNLGFDPLGRLWIVTDSDRVLGTNDGCFVCPTTGPERGALRQIMSGPNGAEICGCEITPDGTTVFLSIQHPGDGGSVDDPVSHWPDGGDLPARAAVIAVRREDGDPL